MTVPWNIFSVPLPPQESPNIFPEIDNVSDEFVIKRKEASVEGEKGEFVGPFCKKTDLPKGFGVYVSDDEAWVHCGEVKDGRFAEGRRVSVNRAKQVLKLVNTRYQPDGSVL